MCIQNDIFGAWHCHLDCKGSLHKPIQKLLHFLCGRISFVEHSPLVKTVGIYWGQSDCLRHHPATELLAL